MDLHTVEHERPPMRSSRRARLGLSVQLSPRDTRVSQALLHATLSGQHAPALTMETETP